MRFRNPSAWVCLVVALGHAAVAFVILTLVGFGWLMYAGDAIDGVSAEEQQAFDHFFAVIALIGGLAVITALVSPLFRGGSLGLLGVLGVETYGLAAAGGVTPEVSALFVGLTVVTLAALVWDVCSDTPDTGPKPRDRALQARRMAEHQHWAYQQSFGQGMPRTEPGVSSSGRPLPQSQRGTW